MSVQYTCRSQLLNAPWSLLSLQVLNIKFSLNVLAPPKPSLKFTPARGPLKKMLPDMVFWHDFAWKYSEDSAGEKLRYVLIMCSRSVREREQNSNL
jgi:hypothetical protein